MQPPKVHAYNKAGATHALYAGQQQRHKQDKSGKGQRHQDDRKKKVKEVPKAKKQEKPAPVKSNGKGNTKPSRAKNNKR